MLQTPRNYLTVLCACVAALTSADAAANMAAPWQPGVMAGEPFGVTAELSIRAERLSIDMRPVAERDPALVHVVYTVENPLVPRSVVLDFVATQISDAPVVTVDGDAVPSERQEDAELPEAWAAPETAPSFEADAVQLETWKTTGVHRFHVTLAPGQHTIDVRYAAEPATFDGRAILREHTVAYALAPARAWKSFGGLDVEVLLPPGWDAKSLPPLTRAGDALTGKFAALPADHLVITARPPLVSAPDTEPFWVGLLGGLALAIFVGARVGRRPRLNPLLALAAAAFAAVAAVALVWLAEAALSPDLARGLISRRYSYGHGISLLFFSAVSAAAAALATLIAVAVARRRSPNRA
ncbi:MAG: hypothetical protein R3F39_25515 [Myxococcota bacterium]